MKSIVFIECKSRNEMGNFQSDVICDINKGAIQCYTSLHYYKTSDNHFVVTQLCLPYSFWGSNM